jgi:hypothetical protein
LSVDVEGGPVRRAGRGSVVAILAWMPTEGKPANKTVRMYKN